MATKVSVSHTVTIYVDGLSDPIELTGAEAVGAVYSFTHGMPIEYNDLDHEGCINVILPSAVCMVTDCATASSETVKDPTCVEDKGGGK